MLKAKGEHQRYVLLVLNITDECLDRSNGDDAAAQKATATPRKRSAPTTPRETPSKKAKSPKKSDTTSKTADVDDEEDNGGSTKTKVKVEDFADVPFN